MTAFADLHEFVNRFTGGNSGSPQYKTWHKEHRSGGAAAATPIAGFPISLWTMEGAPSHGAVPTTVAAPTNATQGSWKQTDPSGGRQLWTSQIGASRTAAGTLWLCDRLLHIGSLDGTVTTAQTVGGSLTRNTGGAGNMIAVEIYTQIGASATTVTASYTNQAGTSGQTTQAIAIGNTNRREAQRFLPLSLAAGDTGVQAVASCTLAATTGTAGNFGITVYRPLATLTIAAAAAADIRPMMDQVTEIVTGACLFWVFVPSSTTAPSYDFWFNAAER